MSDHDVRTISVLYPSVITGRYVALDVISAFVAIKFFIPFYLIKSRDKSRTLIEWK